LSKAPQEFVIFYEVPFVPESGKAEKTAGYRMKGSMDISKIALVLSVLALFLSVPLAITANLLTPRIQDWYAITTSRRLAKRLAVLEDEFESVKDTPVATKVEELIFFNGIFLSIFLTTTFSFLLVIPPIAVLLLLKMYPALSQSKLIPLALIVSTLSVFACVIESYVCRWRRALFQRRCTAEGQG
jgi:hypothetical protein